MKLNRRFGLILVALWLLLSGLIALFNLTFTNSDTIMALLALVAGAVLLLEAGGVLNRSRSRRSSRSWGMILLGVWLLLTGLFALIALSFAGQEILMAVLALAAGVLILLER